MMRQFINLIESYLNLPRDGVRTEIHTRPQLLDNPAFNEWFDGSRVCDPHGNPLICFHGTFFDFSRFQNKDLGKGGAGNGFNSLGFWFDTHPGVPTWLAGYEPGYDYSEGTIYPCVLSIKNPLAIDSEWLFAPDRDDLLRLTAELDALYDRKDTETDQWKIGDLDHKITLKRRERDKLMHSVAHDRDDAFYRLMKLLPNGIQSSTAEAKAFKQELMDEGYDGIWIGDTIADFTHRDYKVSDWWIAFHPNQIKTIHAREFNADSAHIHESLSSPVPYEWDHFGKTDLASFTIDGREGEVFFITHPDRTECSFAIDGSESLTGEGDAFAILSTVTRAITDYLADKKPEVLRFTAKSAELSRVALYRRLARLARNFGYIAREGTDPWNDVQFRLLRMDD